MNNVFRTLAQRIKISFMSFERKVVYLLLKTPGRWAGYFNRHIENEVFNHFNELYGEKQRSENPITYEQASKIIDDMKAFRKESMKFFIPIFFSFLGIFFALLSLIVSIINMIKSSHF